MSTAATKEDLDNLHNELISSFDDMTNLLQTFVKHIDERFNIVEIEQQKTRKEIEKVFNYLDSMVKKQEINDDERLVMGHQLERLDKWTHALADKIGYKLTV